jgi:hypothetical protein
MSFELAADEIEGLLCIISSLRKEDVNFNSIVLDMQDTDLCVTIIGVRK